MNHVRWYDKDENMKLLINTLEKLPFDAQHSVAQEIIQILMQKDFDVNAFIEKMEYIPNRHRWYDKSESLHSAIKMLKELSVDERREIFSEIFSSVFEIIQQCKSKD